MRRRWSDMIQYFIRTLFRGSIVEDRALRRDRTVGTT
ncbi:hypothetical protein SSE37_21122 [Sagittula stellata E-37]|uniref:Uncharacterized protein n=1 Tax=Sagittula stellata (strain ATCC 700073 / DSM 11524 / E-37) TaxID=388399 RepID=A3JYG2_SAGS3|nr:hypothetical protein SSE37_21122 [Sagittula stellata E-37]